MYEYSPTDSGHVRIYGRTVLRDPLPIFWTAGGVEFDTDATECFIDIECDYSIKELWLRVEMDGFLIQRFMIPKGRGEYCLFRSFPEGELRTITVVMETQPMQDDPVRKLLIHQIKSDRLLQPIAPKSHRIEFIGDSLTSGEGLTGTADIKEWCTGIYGLTGHYGLKIAKRFDAEYSIVSQSGWGVCCGFDNNIYNNIPRYYTQVCGILDGDMNGALGAYEDWDFTKWQPELIIINLGTNDGGAAINPEWTDPSTGEIHKQRLGEDGELDEQSERVFKDAMYDFLINVRANNPDAYILWVYGMCGSFMEPYITDTLEKYKNESGDSRISYQALKECPEAEWGAHMHPGANNHVENADIIIKRVEELGVF